MNDFEFYDYCEQEAKDEARAEREHKRRWQQRDGEEPICNMDDEEICDE